MDRHLLSRLTGEADAWLARIRGGRAHIRYHADVDGCVSAAFWHDVLRARSMAIDHQKISTAEFGFEELNREVLHTADAFVILDVPAGTLFQRWIDAGIGAAVFVYDHHRVKQPIAAGHPRFVQPGSDLADALPPTCVFSWAMHRAATGRDLRWLLNIGLRGEGQAGAFREYVKPWPTLSALTSLIAYGVLRDDDVALEFLEANLAVDDPLDIVARGSLHEKLLETHAAVRAEIDRCVRQFAQPDSKPALLASVVDGKYAIANYVASELTTRRAARVILIGQLSSNGAIRAEMRTAEDLDLRLIVEDLRGQGLIHGGGGHPRAVGMRIAVEQWDHLVKRVRLAVEGYRR